MSLPISDAGLFAACAFLPILLATAIFDLREMRIPNWLSWAGIAVFLACMPILGPDEWFSRSLVGITAFVICFGLFVVGWLGGGDAKILPVTMLYVPLSHIELFLFSFSASMILGMLAIWTARLKYSNPSAKWVSMKPGAAFPMGISIAASLPIAIGVSFLSPI